MAPTLSVCLVTANSSDRLTWWREPGAARDWLHHRAVPALGELLADRHRTHYRLPFHLSPGADGSRSA